MGESLVPLYRILGNDKFYDEFVRVARAAIIKACQQYAAEEFFVSRIAITETMMQYMTQAFNNTDSGLRVTISGLQLREVDLPDEFDEEIANTQEQMQEVQVAQAQREEYIIIMERETLVARQEVNAAKQTALGQAQTILIENEATVSQMLHFQTRQTEANAQILSQFENDSAPFDKLFKSMEIRAIDTHDVSKLLLKV